MMNDMFMRNHFLAKDRKENKKRNMNKLKKCWNRYGLAYALIGIFVGLAVLSILFASASLTAPISVAGIIVTSLTTIWSRQQEAASKLEKESHWREMLFELSETDVLKTAQINKLRTLMRYEKKKNSDEYIKKYKSNDEDISEGSISDSESKDIYEFDLMTALIIYLCDVEWRRQNIKSKQINEQFQIIIRYLLKHHWESQQNGGGKKIDDEDELTRYTFGHLVEMRGK